MGFGQRLRYSNYCDEQKNLQLIIGFSAKSFNIVYGWPQCLDYGMEKKSHLLPAQ